MITKREGFCHAAGVIGHNLIYALVSGYLLLYYTDVLGLSGIFTGTLFLVARLWDTITDFIVGILSDKFTSKFGKRRVWIAVAAPVIAISLILCFLAPTADSRLKYTYVYVTFLLFTMAFTAADVPYWTLPTVITNDPAQRTSVFCLSTIVSALSTGIGVVLIPLIISRSPNDARGYLYCAIIFSFIGIITYLVCVFGTKERRSTEPVRTTFKDIATLFKNNPPLIYIMITGFFGNLAIQFRLSSSIYYAEYVLGDPKYVTIISACFLAGLVVGASIAPQFVKNTSGNVGLHATLMVGAIFSMVSYFVGYKSVLMVCFFSFIVSVTVGMFTVLVNVLTADAIDFEEYMTGRRHEGIITSTRTLVSKLATAIAGAAAGFALDLINYIPNAKQTEIVFDSLHRMTNFYPALILLISTVTMLFYPMKKNDFLEMQASLKERHKKED